MWRQTRRAAVGAAASFLLALAGCGGSAPPTSERARLAEVHALALRICRGERGRERETGSAYGQPLNAVLLALMLRGDLTIPRVRTLAASFAARRRLRKELKERPTGTAVSSVIARAYQLNERIYNEERALGLPSCLIRAPRKPIRG
jgi:hypothetical protein